MNGVSPIFFVFTRSATKTAQGEAAGAAADEGNAQAFPITYIRFGMIS